MARDQEDGPEGSENPEDRAVEYQERLRKHAIDKARAGAESLAEAANAGLMAGALRLSQPVAEWVRETSEGFLALLGSDEDDDE